MDMTPALLINIIIIVTITAFMLLIGVLLFRKLRENERLKYEFITIIAHRFRTPLTQIKWSTEGLIGQETDSYKKQTVTEIHDSNEKLIKLTGTLVELTDAAETVNSAYQFERINLCELARTAADASKDLFHSKNLFMSVSCADSEIYVYADRSRLEFVLSTLFENACSYTPPGRNITVNVSAEHRKAAVSVTDDGIGIDPRDMSKMFTKFYRTKQAVTMDTEGIGVALFLAKSIITRHHGRIAAFSEGLNRGSTFSIILPRVK